MDGLRIAVKEGGMVVVEDDTKALRAAVWFVPAGDGRLIPVDLTLRRFDPDTSSPERLRGSDVREFPLARVEAMVNGELRDQVLESIETADDPGTIIRRQAEQFRQVAAELRDEILKRVGEGWDPERLHLETPTTRAYPDEFYREVADRYHYATWYGQRPAADIAEVNDVPVKTVHRWIAEARKRGYLPPGQRGKAG